LLRLGIHRAGSRSPLGCKRFARSNVLDARKCDRN
jgi:hypothetical protein